MKVAAQADFFIKHYGVEHALKKLKATGYEYITYEISGRYDEPFTTQWTDWDIKEQFSPIGVCATNENLNLAYTTLKSCIYHDLLPETSEARKQMCIQAVKATACMGCPVFAIRPAAMFYKRPDIYEVTKKISWDIFESVKQTADRVGVQLAFVNNNCCYAYGSRIDDLIELSEHFDGKIVIDPMNAYEAHENEMELAKQAGDRLLAFCVTDLEGDEGNPFHFTGKQRTIMPMMGALNYPLIIDRMKAVNQEAIVSVIYNDVLERYVDFVDSEPLMDAFDKLFYKTGCLIADTLDER